MPFDCANDLIILRYNIHDRQHIRGRIKQGSWNLHEKSKSIEDNGAKTNGMDP